MVKKQEEKWITFDDGAFITKRNWKIRTLTRIMIINALCLIPFLTIGYLTVISAPAWSDLISIVGFIGLFFLTFKIAKWLGNKFFFSYMNNFLIHYKDDWRPNGVTRNET